MEKEDVLLRNYSVLVKNPIKNGDAIKSLIGQMCQINPKIGFRCWSELLQAKALDISENIQNNSFDFHSIGYIYIERLEHELVEDDAFVLALDEFVKNKVLLEFLYSKYPVNSYTSICYPIAYFIRKKRLADANTLLSFLYKNKYFQSYSELWKRIVDRFKYSDEDAYSNGGFVSKDNYKKDNDVQEFCLNWVDRIIDEEEHASALTYIMRIF